MSKYLSWQTSLLCYLTFGVLGLGLLLRYLGVDYIIYSLPIAMSVLFGFGFGVGLVYELLIDRKDPKVSIQ